MKVDDIINEDDYYGPADVDNSRTEAELNAFLDGYVTNHLGAPHQANAQRDMGIIVSIPRDKSGSWHYNGQRQDWIDTGTDLVDELKQAGFGEYELSHVTPNYIELDKFNLTEATIDGAATHPVTGLYDAEVGDIIEIGIEGQRNKIQTKIAKTTPAKVRDSEGNIFHRSGMIYRRKSGFQASTLAPGKKVYAKLVTQKGLDSSHDKDRRKYLSQQNWDTLPADKIEKILKIMNVTFGDMQKQRRYHAG